MHVVFGAMHESDCGTRRTYSGKLAHVRFEG
jgi:hypothetical protein